MATQPNVSNQASIPPPQTNFMVMQQRGLMTKTDGIMPGERPDKDIEMARPQLIGVANLNTDQTIGTRLTFTLNTTSAINSSFPLLPVRETDGLDWRTQPAYSCQFYFHQSTYWNADVVLHLWAVKPPAAIGRLRIVYTPPASTEGAIDIANREITKVWDLSASNLFEFKIPSYNLREYRNCVANYAPLNGLASIYKSARSDYKVGFVKIYITHLYQPGSIFPTNCNIYMFQSFQNSQFSVFQGPAVPVERTALTINNNPT
nr:MAG: putative capsid protein [Picornavirales sp.]